MAKGLVCAIHQPNFFPWLGYFDKIRETDVFVFLDAVEYPKNGMTNRVKVSGPGGEHWFGVPVTRTSGVLVIKDAEIADHPPWRRKLLGTLQADYARAPRYKEAMALIEPLLTADEPNLARYNMTAIRAVAAALGLNTRFVLQSELATTRRSTALLIEICKAVGAEAYLAGGGAGGYQDDALFMDEGVALAYQGFTPFPYGDETSWRPGLSVIDFLMRSPDWRWPGASSASPAA